MKFLFDFFPTIIFFIVYKLYGFFPATYAIIIASICQVAILWIKHRKIEPMHIALLVMVVFFGGLTIYFHDAEFLMWKVSIVNWAIGGAMLVSHFFKTNILKYMFDFAYRQQGQQHDIPRHVINKLNIAWGVFFAVIGFINLFVAFHMSMNAWVNFKAFGILGLTLAFAIGQSVYLYRYLKDAKS